MSMKNASTDRKVEATQSKQSNKSNKQFVSTHKCNGSVENLW